MFWIDALVEMKKNKDKVFTLETETGEWEYKLEKDCVYEIESWSLVNRVVNDKNSAYQNWYARGVWPNHIEQDWVEMPKLREVNYSEFMEWYCDKNNLNKEFYVTLEGHSGKDHWAMNLMDMTPRYFLEKGSNFKVSNS